MTQILSYPLLLKLSKSDFYDYYDSYTKRISFIVIPLMTFEVCKGLLQVIKSIGTVNFILKNLVLNNFYHL